MSQESQAPPTELLDRLRSGDPEAMNQLLPLVYDQLRARARYLMAHQEGGHTLQPTALVHEAWERIARAKGVQVESRSAFLGLAATAMRNVLIDHARARQAAKRGGGAHRVDLTLSGFGAEENEEFVLHLHESVQRLAELDPALGRIAELRCFGGLEHQEIAEVTGTSLRSVERHWRAVRAWLSKEIA